MTHSDASATNPSDGLDTVVIGGQMVEGLGNILALNFPEDYAKAIQAAHRCQCFTYPMGIREVWLCDNCGANIFFHDKKHDAELNDDKEVKAAYRNWLLAAHPDTGGDHERFVRVKAKAERLLEELKPL